MVTYTLPNTREIGRKRGLAYRAGMVRSLNSSLRTSAFGLVEVPADFVKKGTEERDTGLQHGDMLLDLRSVERLYGPRTVSSRGIKY